MSPDQRFEDSHRNGHRTLRGREGVKLGPLLPQGRVVDGDQGSGDHGQEADEAGFMACAPIVFHLDIDNVHSWENIGFEDPVAMEQEIEVEQPAIAFEPHYQCRFCSDFALAFIVLGRMLKNFSCHPASRSLSWTWGGLLFVLSARWHGDFTTRTSGLGSTTCCNGDRVHQKN